MAYRGSPTGSHDRGRPKEVVQIHFGEFGVKAKQSHHGLAARLVARSHGGKNVDFIASHVGLEGVVAHVLAVPN